MKKFKAYIITLIILCISITLKADERPTIHSLIGKEFIIEDTWAGQSFTLQEKNDKLSVIWKIFGSGVPVVSETEYPVTKKSDWQYVFHVPNGTSKNEIKVSIHDEKITKVYINNIRIYAKKNES